MAEAQTQLFCRYCQRYTRFTKPSIGAGMGCLLTIFTAGLFLLIWPLIGLYHTILTPWRCQGCGQARRV